MNYCPKCKKYVEDDTLRFCEDCGTPFIRLKTEKTEIDKASNLIVDKAVEKEKENEVAVNVMLQQTEKAVGNAQTEAKKQVKENDSLFVNQNG